MVILSRHSNLFEPIKIGQLEIKNRFVLAPMGPAGLAAEDGSFNRRGVEFYVERAKGGAGLLIVGLTFVENEIENFPMPSSPCPTINPRNFIKTAREMTERVHAYDTKIFIQLSAGFGRVAPPKALMKNQTPVAPSPIPNRYEPNIICRELTVNEIKTYVQKFAEAAAICKTAGFDGIEIHAVHEGYLLDQFTIPLFNRRTDEYGGTLMNRLRFPIEIVESIKHECGIEYPVALRFSLKSFIKDWCEGGLPGEDFEEKGRDIEEGLEIAKVLEDAGYDAFDADVGTYDAWYWNHPPMYQEKGLYLPYNELLKKVLKVPVITAGRMDNPDLACSAISEGRTDMIGLGRPLLADPDLPNKIKEGRIEKIRPCLSCQEGCMGRLPAYGAIGCAVNPAAAREKDYGLELAKVVKRILVVGGGVAGCEAARVCALRGHKVTLYEKSPRLGGNLIAGGAPDFKDDEIKLAQWYTREIEDLKIDVHFNCTVTKEIIKNGDFDAIIIATGSTPKMISIDGDLSNIFTAEDVLLGKKDPGNSTVIIGGGLVGCETALWLAQQGKKVTIVELLDDILEVGGPLCKANSDMLRALLKYNNVTIKTEAFLMSASDNGFIVKFRNRQENIVADSVIVSIGYRPQRELFDEIKNDFPQAYLLGDARVVQNIMYAIWDAYEVAKNI